jgi:hypothetical protein
VSEAVVRFSVLCFGFLVAIPSLFGCSGNSGESKQEPAWLEAQSAEPRSTRSFQMGLWFNPAGADADVAFFSDEDAQPQGRSVLFLGGWRNPDGHAIQSDFAAELAARGYDWSRIAAVVVDEPYLYYTGNTDRSNPCSDPNDPRNEQIAQIASQLEQAAAILRDLSPTTRYWVNFSVPEMQWAADSRCPVRINQWYIDVISLDAYGGRFEDVAWPHYEWLQANRATPYQQLALVPGTFYREGVDNQHVQASYLSSYFAYADSLNESCDLPAGRVGVTGLWDGCAIWIVAGWSGATHSIGKHVYRGALDPAATAISAAWREKLAYPTLDPILGSVEKYDPATRTFTGWAVNRNTRGVPQQIELWVNGHHADSTVGALYRADIGDEYGIYEAGFSVALPQDAASDACIKAEIRTASPTSDPRNQVSLPSNVRADSC